MAVWSSNAGRTLPWLIVVDDDVDPFDMWRVLHSLVMKCHPDRDIVKTQRSIGIGYFPSSNKHERKYRMGSKVYFDCTWPLDWDESDVPELVSFEEIYTPEVQQKALAKWHKYGY